MAPPQEEEIKFETIVVGDGSTKCPAYSYFDVESSVCLRSVCPDYYFLTINGMCNQNECEEYYYLE